MIRFAALALPLVFVAITFTADATSRTRSRNRSLGAMATAQATFREAVDARRRHVDELLRRLEDEPRMRAALAAGHAGGNASAHLKDDEFLVSWLDESLGPDVDLLVLVGGDGKVALGLAGHGERKEVGEEVFLDRQLSSLVGELSGSAGTVAMLWSGLRLHSGAAPLAALDRRVYVAAGTMIRFGGAGEPAAGLAVTATALDLPASSGGAQIVLADGKTILAGGESTPVATAAAGWAETAPVGELLAVELAGAPYHATVFDIAGVLAGPVRAAVLVPREDELASRQTLRLVLLALAAVSLVPAIVSGRSLLRTRRARVAAPIVAPPDEPARDFAGRTLLGRYAVRGRLGEGGFAAVYLADHLELQSKVAIKVLETRNRPLAAEGVERFRREAWAASRLTHPCAVKIFDRGETEDGFFWIAMEYLEGETLDRYRSRTGTLPAAEVVDLFVPICEVLAEAHEKGIVHRDLKPQNVMLVSTVGRRMPKVFDFGIAGLETDRSVTQTGTIVGTPSYMAPEQWDGLQFADARSDIYSLGVMAYECLAGKLPLEADTMLALLNKLRYEEPRDLADAAGSTVPAALCRAVMKAISKNPDERPRTALDLRDAFAASLRD